MKDNEYDQLTQFKNEYENVQTPADLKSLIDSFLEAFPLEPHQVKTSRIS
ncbi:hypothetical protein ACTXGU_00215 [Niallia sp. 01092]